MRPRHPKEGPSGPTGRVPQAARNRVVFVLCRVFRSAKVHVLRAARPWVRAPAPTKRAVTLELQRIPGDDRLRRGRLVGVVASRGARAAS